MKTDITGALDRLLKQAESDSSHYTDPLVMASESARAVLTTTDHSSPKDVVSELSSVMPRSTTAFERSVALGMVLALRAVERAT